MVLCSGTCSLQGEIMPRIARVAITNAFLEQATGIDLKGIRIVHAQVSYTSYMSPVFELVLVGDNLPECFTVSAEGDVIKKGIIVLHKVHTETEVREVRDNG